MPLRPVASLAVKLLGLYIAVQALSSLGVVWLLALNVYRGNVFCGIIGCFPNWDNVVPGLMGGLMQLATSAALWLFSDVVARFLVKDDAPVPVSTLKLRLSLGRVVGALVLVESACQVAALFAAYGNRWETPHVPVFVIVARCFVGLSLLFGPVIVRSLLNFKNWGRDPETL